MVEQRINGIPEIRSRDGLRVLPVVIDFPRVPEMSVLVKYKELGSVRGPVSFGNFLARITEVGKVEIFFL